MTADLPTRDEIANAQLPEYVPWPVQQLMVAYADGRLIDRQNISVAATLRLAKTTGLDSNKALLYLADALEAWHE